MDEGRFQTAAARRAPGLPRAAAVAVSAAGHAALLGLLLLISRPQPTEPQQQTEPEVRFVQFPRPPRPLEKPPAPRAESIAPLAAPPVALAEPVKAVSTGEPEKKLAQVLARPKNPKKAIGRAPKPRLRDLDRTALAPEGDLRSADEAAREAERRAARESALRGAAEAARASAAESIATNAGLSAARGSGAPGAERGGERGDSGEATGPTPQEERRAFAAALAEAFRAHWVLPPGSAREAALVALTVRLAGAGYRLDCAPASGFGGESEPRACAAIAAAALPALPPSLHRDGLTLKFRFVP